jgi:hypothetical protein
MTDQITRAFRTLQKSGYFARKNWTCCQTCGIAEIPDGVEKYVFYHDQDATGLWENGETHLCWRGDPKFICDTLQAAGLEVEHNGDDRTRILIKLPKDAKRPRPTYTLEELERSLHV